MKFNQKLIDKVLNKEASILHTQNPDDLETLIQLLKAIFPEDKYEPNGTSKYYYNDINNKWDSSGYNLNRESIPLKDFILKELPAVWCVKDDGSQLFKDTVIKYLNDKFKEKLNGGNRNYYYGITIDKNINFFMPNNIEKYFENNILTLEEFIEITQMNTKNTNKKIIGYKTPYDLYNGEIKKGTTCVKYSHGNVKKAYRAINYNPNGYYALASEIVETWEPVYEEEYKVGDWVIGWHCIYKSFKETPWKIYKIEENYIYSDNYSNTGISNIRKATKEEIDNFLNITINNYKLEITSNNDFKFGCNNFTRNQLDAYILLVEREADITMFGTKIDLELLNKIKVQLDNYE